MNAKPCSSVSGLCRWASKSAAHKVRLHSCVGSLLNYFLHFTNFRAPKAPCLRDKHIFIFCFYAFAINYATIVEVNLLAYLYSYNDTEEKHTL